MKTIALEDIATVFASEFAKECGYYLETHVHYNSRINDVSHYKPFLKMNYSRRRKLVEKVLDKMSK